VVGAGWDWFVDQTPTDDSELAHPGLHLTIDTEVKDMGNAVEGTPTMVFDDGQGHTLGTLTFYYEVWQMQGTILFDGSFTIQGGTGLFAGASGSGEICYPVDGRGTGALMMDGSLIL
jgi:hypothetical protein